MIQGDFETVLDLAVERLNKDVSAGKKYFKPLDFQDRVLKVLQEVARSVGGIDIGPTFHPHAFPDIRANGYGVEVKSVANDSWLSVGNSIFEGMRDRDVKDIYVIFGKLGGMPAVKWGRYEETITHVRISHAPRFVLEMETDTASHVPLFSKMNISYEDFSKLGAIEKMAHVRDYSRKRLKPGETLWWLEEDGGPGIELKVELYMRLPPERKLQIRAEAALLFPGIVAGSRVRNKYEGVPFFILKYHNVYCPQTRDLFSAGSVAGKERGGNYLLRSLERIQGAMRQAAIDLPDDLFLEYWEEGVPVADRIPRWLEKADSLAKDWVPSDHLFTGLDEDASSEEFDDPAPQDV
ncbi:MAG: restriction endonuclease [Armatimonadetes bacterium]|nr:restriction endonuclease [Armatimonadota bacterium]MDE2205731.1 restriction endonuclease [Armatimonadota bacterium]